MAKLRKKHCRGCGGPKDRGERAHFCSRCEKSPFARPNIVNGKCKRGHDLETAGIIVHGRRWRCKLCLSIKVKQRWASKIGRERSYTSSRKSRLRRVYGITEEQWTQMYDMQKGLCFICGKTLRKKPGEFGKIAAVDHRHSDRLIRGLLCMRPCNYTLGLFKDNADMFLAASNYLRQPPAASLQLYTPEKPIRKRRGR